MSNAVPHLRTGIKLVYIYADPRVLKVRDKPGKVFTLSLERVVALPALVVRKAITSGVLVRYLSELCELCVVLIERYKLHVYYSLDRDSLRSLISNAASLAPTFPKRPPL